MESGEGKEECTFLGSSGGNYLESLPFLRGQLLQGGFLLELKDLSLMYNHSLLLPPHKGIKFLYSLTMEMSLSCKLRLPTSVLCPELSSSILSIDGERQDSGGQSSTILLTSSGVTRTP